MHYPLNILSKNLALLRSKNTAITLIQQNCSQLDVLYGEAGRRSLIGNCNYQIILGSNDDASNKVYSSMCGDKRTLRKSSSLNHSNYQSTGSTAQEDRERVFPPEMFGDLGDKMVLYFKGKYCLCNKFNAHKDPAPVVVRDDDPVVYDDTEALDGIDDLDYTKTEDADFEFLMK